MHAYSLNKLIQGKHLENVSAEKEALHIIAMKADGSLRDALSIFDQIATFAGNKISYSDVIENLNILDYDYYFKLSEAIEKEDVSATLIILNEIYEKGFDGHNFIIEYPNDFIHHFLSNFKNRTIIETV